MPHHKNASSLSTKKNGPTHLCTVFSPLCGTVVQKKNGKQDPMDEKSNDTVSRNRETQGDVHRDSKRQRLSSIATRHFKPQQGGVLKYWDHVNGGELSAREVQKARRLEVVYLNKMKVVERVPYSFIKRRTGKEPIKVRWVDTLRNSGIHRSRLLAKDFRRGSKVDGFMNFSATPPLESVKLMISMVATAQWDQAAWFGQDGHESISKIVMMHTDINRAYFHAPCREEKYVELPPEMSSEGYP